MITTYMLFVLFAYSNSGPNEPGSVALQSEKIDFFSKKECDAAKAVILDAAQKAGYRRVIATCFQRGSAMLEAKPADEK
jgi:hypothetical protein